MGIKAEIKTQTLGPKATYQKLSDSHCMQAALMGSFLLVKVQCLLSSLTAIKHQWWKLIR